MSNDSSKVSAVIAADLGGTHLRVATVDEGGRIHFRLKQNTPRAETPEVIVDALVSAARTCEEQSPDADVRAVSVVIPGLVNVATGVIVRVPNVGGLDGFQIVEVLRQRLGRPVILENDANAAAVGEMWQGAGRGKRTLVCLTLGTGVGGGIILDGKLWRGVTDTAGEIGHSSVEVFGPPCNCGSRGCLEVYASATGIVRMTREALSKHPHSILREKAELTAKEVYRAGVQGDELALEVFHRMGMYLGVGLANLVNILNPELIVIGGGVAGGWDLFAKDMNEQIATRAFPVPARHVKVVPAECGDDAGLLGAAWLGFSEI
ncbi:MAG: ROK family protein [Acidobacteriota bacterium]